MGKYKLSELESQTSICDNRQCRACKFVARSHMGTKVSCNYILKMYEPRGCDIPFCEKFQPAKGKAKPTNLKKEEFRLWYLAFGSDEDKEWAGEKKKGYALNRPILRFNEQHELIGRYETLSEAVKATGYKKSYLHARASGKMLKGANGDYFFFEDDIQRVSEFVNQPFVVAEKIETGEKRLYAGIESACDAYRQLSYKKIDRMCRTGEAYNGLIMRYKEGVSEL